MENVGNGYVPIAFKLEPGFSKFICVAHTSLDQHEEAEAIMQGCVDFFREEANQLPALDRR